MKLRKFFTELSFFETENRHIPKEFDFLFNNKRIGKITNNRKLFVSNSALQVLFNVKFFMLRFFKINIMVVSI